MSLITRLWKWVRNKIYSLEVTPYLISFEELVKRAEDRMMIIPVCPYCDIVMEFRNSNIVIGAGPIRDDQTYKCTKCFHKLNWGLPMTKLDAEEEKRLRGGSYLLRPTLRLDERDLDVIKERLRRLGYIE